MVFDRWQHRGWHYAFLITAGTLLFLLNLGGASLWDLDEGRNAGCSTEMYHSGDYIVPHFNGSLRVDKPVLLYWFQVAAYHIFGINEFSARLPSALAALLTVLLCYELARSMFGKTTALLAGLVVASTPMVIGAARFANPDALLHCCIVLTMYLFWIGHRRPTAWWFASLGVAAGLAMLAKGPVGLVVPGTIVLVYCWWTGQLGIFWNRYLGQTIMWCALVALPWYIWVGVETKGEFLRGFLFNHNVNRFLEPMESHRGSPLYYFVVLLVGTVPWSVFMGLSLWYGFWSLRSQPGEKWQATWQTAADQAPFRQDAYRFLAVWIGAFLLFFTAAATKLPNYVLPTLVPLSIVIARFLDRWRKSEVNPPPWTLAISFGFLLVLGLSTGIGLVIAGGGLSIPELQGRTIAGLDRGAALGLVPILSAALGWWFVRRQQRLRVVVTMGVTALAFLVPLASWASAALNSVKAAKPLVEQARALQRQRDMRIGVRQLEHLPSLNFYLQRDVTHLQSSEEALLFLEYPLPVFLFLPAREWDDIKHQAPASVRELGRHRDLYRNYDVVVVSNR